MKARARIEALTVESEQAANISPLDEVGQIAEQFVDLLESFENEDAAKAQ